MNEEVKKAIDVMRDYIRDFEIDGKYPYLRDSMKVVDKLIDKQQKEIEELRTRLQDTLSRQKNTLYFCIDDYVSKNKIREIIKKYSEEDVITYKELTDLVAELNDLAY